MAHNYAKFFLLKAYIVVYKFDKVRISERYLDSSIASDDGNLKISWYHLIRSEDPTNSKRGGVCICYKSIILLTVFNIHYLQEFISFKLKISGKLFQFDFSL